MSIRKIDISFFSSVIFRDVYVEYQKKDTLVFIKNFDAHVTSLNLSENKVFLDKIIIDDLYANLYEDSTKVMNMQFLLDAFASKEKKKKKDTTQSAFSVLCQNFMIRNTRFSMKKYKPAELKHGLNLDDLYFSDFNLDIKGLAIHGDTIDVHLDSLRIKEKSGLCIENLSTWLQFTGKNIDLRQFELKTPNTDLKAPQLTFGFDSLGDFSDFLNRVELTAKLEESKFGADDIAYIVTDLWGINQSIKISGELTGKVCNLKAKNLDLQYGKHTLVQTDFKIKGLPDINNTRVDIDVKKIKVSQNDLAQIKLPPFTENHPLQLPPQVGMLGTIAYHGTLNGGITDLVTKGTITTDIGELVTDIILKNDTAKKEMQFDGKVKATCLNIGKLAANEQLMGTITADLTVKGKKFKNNKFDATAKGFISSVEFNNYTYQNITLDGVLNDKKLNSKITVNDPNVTLTLDAKGELDKQAAINMTLNVDRADLKRLKLNPSDTMSLASLQLNADLKGSNADDLTGKLVLAKVYYANQKGSISMQDFVLNLNDYNSYRKVSLASDLLDVDLIGQYKLQPLIGSLSNLVYKYLPSFASPNYVAQTDTTVNNIKFDIKIKRTDEICKLFAPALKLNPRTRISGTFNSATHQFAFKGTIPEIVSGDNIITNLYLDAFTANNALSVNIEGNRINAAGLKVENLSLNADIRNDSIYIAANNHNRDSAEFGVNLSMLAYFTKPENHKNTIINIEIEPSEFILGDVAWKLDESKIQIDTSAIKIENLKIQNRYQFLNINGKVSQKPSDTLSIFFNKIDLAGLSAMLGTSGPKITGRLDGYANVNDVYNKVLFNSDISIKGFTFNQEMLGNTFVKTNWNEETKKIALQVYTKIGKVKTLTINGDYSPVTKQIAFDINLNRLKLNILQPFLTGIVSGLKGEVNGNFTVSGTADKPLIEGSLDILETYFTLDFSKVRYCIKNTVQITNNEIKFEEFNIFDPNWKMLVLNGSVKHHNFQDIRLDLIMNTTDNAFMFLNTEEADNDAFYGTAYMTGVFKIQGSPENIVVDIAAKTEKDTYFYIPLTSTSEATESDFITFINKQEKKDSTKNAKGEKVNISGVTLNFDLEITPDAEAQIVFDAKTGDLIKGRGSSNLKIEINTLGKFNMYGDFVIDRGDYLFTLQNIINKKFDVQKGGYISWNGDPLDATVDLKAVYKLKAPLYDMVLDTSDVYKKRSPTECLLSMTNKLMEPIITFDIDLPTADEKTKTILSSLSSDEKNKQFLSLLILNRFMTPETMKGSTANETKRSSSVGGVTSSELLSNQLSHWLSQISNDFDIGVNYRPGDEISSDQVEVALSTQVLNDRVTINGNVGIGQQKASSSGVVGDFDIAYKITKNGKLRVKAFTKANDNVMNNSPYTQGMGLFYREDFNTFGELARRYWNAIIPAKKL